MVDRPEELRVLGLASSEPEYNDQLSGVGGALHYLFDEIRRRTASLDLYQPTPPLPARIRSALAAARATPPEARRLTYKLNRAVFEAKSRRCQREVDRRAGTLDVLLQWEFFFAPTDGRPATVPYCLYNDWTMALNERHYPHVPLPPGVVRAFPRQRALLRNAAYVFTFTDLVRDSAVRDYGVAPERAVTVGAGINLPSLPPPIRRDYGGSEPTLLLVGNQYVGKGVDTLARALPLVRERFPGARAVVVGGDGQVATGVEGMRTLPAVDKAALTELYRQATMFVLPSRGEAFGHANCEAMAHSLPCVSSDTGGIPEVVDHGATGYLVPVGDHRALAERIVDLLNQPELMARMGAAGYRKVERRFTWQRVVDQMLPYLMKAAGESPDPVAGTRPSRWST